ncbi:D-alanyl-D-alanine carboxypeptidase [Devosia sp. YR412]|uniref:M15 family metallopeptidase n=1 Tax=Devosia sp. YR412 TaxID=1881030 RepID=UPI0008C79EC4|nr:M15 family metallopeptidase [Devosia sp. YR412]SEQ49391.1 D-alanyl-D-alanine carboxypeptidase [Devosia sp. YR412]
MADKPFLASSRYQEQQWRANRTGAHPDILEFEKRFIRRMAKLDVPMFASEVIRSSQRQEDLYALGHSKARAGQSPHGYGCAVDLVHSVHGWNLDRKAWEVIGHVGQEIVTQAGLAIVSLAWGGDWKFYDPAHWEIADWRMVKDDYPWPERA